MLWRLTLCVTFNRRRSGALNSEVNPETLNIDSCHLLLLRGRMKLWRFPRQRRDDLITHQHRGHHACTQDQHGFNLQATQGEVKLLRRCVLTYTCAAIWALDSCNRTKPAELQQEETVSGLDTLAAPHTNSLLANSFRLTRGDFDLQYSRAATKSRMGLNVAHETMMASHLREGWSSRPGCTPEKCFHCRGIEWKRPELG